MSLWESVRTAFRSLWANRLRTSLAVLGIVIGVAAVVTLMAVGEGQRRVVTQRIESLGTNLIFVRPGFGPAQAGVRGAAGSAPTLTYDDAIAIAQQVPYVTRVAPEWGVQAQVASGGQNLSTRLEGVTPDFAAIRGLRVLDGDFFGDQETNGRSLVAVLGAQVASQLFGDSEAVGQMLRVTVGQNLTLPLRVVGVLAPQGGTALGSLDEYVFVPITTLLTRVASQRTARGVANLNTITVQISGSNTLAAAKDAITQLLMDRHRVSDPDFIIQSQEDVLSTLQSITDAETILLSSIAGISLLVGGIGIMNIMLVSVTERTREIGIRKALGARRWDILQQFLVEALTVSVGGGLLGLGLGVGLSRGASGHTLGGRVIVTAITPQAVILSFIVAAAIGVFFGLYPAVRAARLDPIVALRYE